MPAPRRSGGRGNRISIERGLATWATQDLRATQVAFCRALLEDPSSALAQSSLLQLSFYDELDSAAGRLRAHQLWGKQIPPHSVNPIRHDRPRVGYLGLEFAQRPCGMFMQPILQNHDRAAFDIYCYTTASAEPKNCNVRWRDLSGESAVDIVATALQDQIDILVNLDGHADPIAIEAFARRAAPVQVSLAIYPGSTGLTSMDYRITDVIADPIGSSDGLYSEELRRLSCFIPFEPPESTPGIDPPPSVRHGFTIFGVFANPIKIAPKCLEAWARILIKVPSARLVFHHPLLAGSAPAGRNVIDTGIKSRLLAPFLAAAISPERIAFIGGLEYLDHLDFHNEVDLILDTVPYNGFTTTFEGLWMGVCTLTLEGESFVDRTTHAIQHHVGLKGFSPASWEDYIERAVQLTQTSELSTLRQNLRRLVATSCLTDVRGWVSELEGAYRDFMKRQGILP